MMLLITAQASTSSAYAVFEHGGLNWQSVAIQTPDGTAYGIIERPKGITHG